SRHCCHREGAAKHAAPSLSVRTIVSSLFLPAFAPREVAICEAEGWGHVPTHVYLIFSP
ncbi:hypothetical protein NDU88_001589, partial [Pleurodeles waltl]